jgi:hypothetical protein
MPMYRVYRMKDAPRQQFRWAPHVAGAAGVKAKDYEPEGEIQADSEYDAWSRLRASERPLAVGDLLETESGALRICKYVGFESASLGCPGSEIRAAGPARAAGQTCRSKRRAHEGTAIRRHHRRLLRQVQAHHEPRGGILAERRARQGSLPDMPQRSRLPARAAASAQSGRAQTGLVQRGAGQGRAG